MVHAVALVRRRTTDWLKRCAVFGAAIAVTGGMIGAAASRAAGADGAQPGWATGGAPADPASQVSADERYARADCAANTLLLFRVRGSGEDAGSDKLGAWTFAAGRAAIKKGWRVRDMQGDYPAPNLPALTQVIRDPATLKHYRDVATNWWPSMKNTLVAAYNRCPQRKVLIAGYSQGALILRYLIRNLPDAVRNQIAQVDVLGDPTADTKVDDSLQHSADLGGRLTDGVDTKVARITHAGFFKQTAYPADIAPRTFQYCLPNDWVCEFNPVSILRAGRKAHEHYDWAGIGRKAANVLKAWNASTTGASAGAFQLSPFGTYSMQVGPLRIPDLATKDTLALADDAFGASDHCFTTPNGNNNSKTHWDDYGVSGDFWTLGAFTNPQTGQVDPSGNGCKDKNQIFIGSLTLAGHGWHTNLGLKIGDSVDRLRELYLAATKHAGQWWLLTKPWIGNTEVGLLNANIRDGRIASFVVSVGAQGE